MNTYTKIDTNIGQVILTAQNNQINGLYFENQKNLNLANYKKAQDSKIFEKAINQILEYFKGQRKVFELDYTLTQGTLFQKKVWQAISKIEFGITVSYSEIANFLNCPKSVRAVANAIGKNPLSIIIPCHRIIAKSGDLAGYAAGLNIKRQLLSLENRAMF